MATMRAGGDPEQYMDPPTMAVGGNDSGGESGSFLAGILDALGIHRQVAKGPRTQKATGRKSRAARNRNSSSDSHRMGQSRSTCLCLT